MEIRWYIKEDESLLFDLIIDEGEEWIDYYSEEGRKRYIKALESSITYIALYNNIICGYVRCKEDDGFGVYVYDLLVGKFYRGRNLGKRLMERVCIDYPNQPIYVMSDVDIYYEKLGFQKIGSIFEAKIKWHNTYKTFLVFIIY